MRACCCVDMVTEATACSMRREANGEDGFSGRRREGWRARVGLGEWCGVVWCGQGCVSARLLSAGRVQRRKRRAAAAQSGPCICGSPWRRRRVDALATAVRQALPQR